MVPPPNRSTTYIIYPHPQTTSVKTTSKTMRQWPFPLPKKKEEKQTLLGKKRRAGNEAESRAAKSLSSRKRLINARDSCCSPSVSCRALCLYLYVYSICIYKRRFLYIYTYSKGRQNVPRLTNWARSSRGSAFLRDSSRGQEAVQQRRPPRLSGDNWAVDWSSGDSQRERESFWYFRAARIECRKNRGSARS